MTLTINPWQAMAMTHATTARSVGSKETDKRTDARSAGRTDTTDRFTLSADAVCN